MRVPSSDKDAGARHDPEVKQTRKGKFISPPVTTGARDTTIDRFLHPCVTPEDFGKHIANQLFDGLAIGYGWAHILGVKVGNSSTCGMRAYAEVCCA